MSTASERASLVPSGSAAAVASKESSTASVLRASSPWPTDRQDTWEFLEGRSSGGRHYEQFMLCLILANVLAFILGSVFDQQYNIDPDTGQYAGLSCEWCDVVFFGNNDDNGLQGFSYLEIVTVAIFTVDYILRLWACTEDPDYPTRGVYLVSFFSLVDLASTLPSYVNLLTPANLAGTQFLRMFRLFRIMRVEGRYSEAFRLFDDVLASKSHVMVTAGFVGGVVWVIVAGFYYVAEKRSFDMIYCPACPDVDVNKCVFDARGLVSCAAAGCTEQCWNLFESIPASMFQTLLNLFGEFPLASRYSSTGMVIGGFSAAVAAVVFGIPCGILGSGFQEMMEKRRHTADDAADPLLASPLRSYGATSAGSYGDASARAPPSQLRLWLYRLLFGHGQSSNADVVENVFLLLICLSTLTFMLETTQLVITYPELALTCRNIESVTVLVFTVEYIARAYVVGVDPQHAGFAGLLKYLSSFFAVVDLLSIAPYYIGLLAYGSAGETMFLRSLRLLRILRTKHFLEAYTVLEGVVRAQADLLIVTGFAALVFWVLFSSLMYYTERSNPDAEMRAYYRTIPHAMWPTLLNLSGECPLCMYTTPGKWILGIIGVFAVGFVSVPIGVLSAGFQDYAASRRGRLDSEAPSSVSSTAGAEDETDGIADDSWLSRTRAFLEGRTSLGQAFEALVLLLIFATVLLAILETTPGLKCEGDSYNRNWCPTFSFLEAFSVAVFTLEYILRLYAAEGHRLGFVFSFYSLVDLAAIVPWYISIAQPGGWVDQHNEIFLVLRILRLLKLDKVCPSLTLVDDVFRLQWPSLVVTGIVAVITLVFFNALLYLAEYNDTTNVIDPVPLSGCSDDCTQSLRFQSAFDSLPFVEIHLTGDYPIIEYTLAGKVVCFFMVVAGAGLVGIPTGIIADGFSSVVEKTRGEGSALRDYDVQLARLGDAPAPREFTSDALDRLQTDINALLNGTPGKGGAVQRSIASKFINAGILILIVLNVAAVLAESMPSVEASAFLDDFETVVVVVFTIEYALRLFSVTKDKAHLYSRYCYFTTFFGIVDFVTIAPFYVQKVLEVQGMASEDATDIFRLVRLFRLLELERFITAFTVLDNVFWRSRGVLAATGLLALSIWLSAAALFYVFEESNPNWCVEFATPACQKAWEPGCVCAKGSTFDTMPHSLFFTAVFLAGEWAVVDFTLPGKLLCILLCVVGIALAALPVGILFDSFGAVLEEGLGALDEEDEGEA